MDKPMLISSNARSLPCKHTNRCRGVVLVIVLLAMVLLAAMVFYVFNVGRSVQSRVVVQNAADSAAVAGAGEVARAMNTVAMNNVEISRQIALVNVLDCMPQALDFTLKDQRSLAQAISEQLSRGVTDRWVRDVLVQMLAEVNEEVALLEPMDQLFNRSGYDVREATYYNSPNGRGELWRAMLALDQLSQATMQALPYTAQAAAIRAGEVNLGDNSDAAAFLLPTIDELPWQRGRFDDFERAVSRGLTPQAVATAEQSDWHLYRGPFDAIFGWRWLDNDTTGWQAGNSRGSVPIGSASQGRSFQRTPEPEFYRTFGPETGLVELHARYRLDNLPHSRFAYTSRTSGGRPLGDTDYWVNRLSRIKLRYLWPNANATAAGAASRPLVSVVDPDWTTSFPRARNLGENDPNQIEHTRFIAVEIKSRYQRGSSQFLSPGSWAFSHDNQTVSPRVVYVRGWEDPSDWNVSRPNSYIWRDEWTYTTYSDAEIGLMPAYDEDDTPIAHTVYRIDSFVFAGADAGQEVEVRNPHNFASIGDLAAPIDLDHTRVKPDQTSRRQWLTFLSVVRRPTPARFWPGRFDAQKVQPAQFSIAQARVFNNHSWDMWTQMWHAQLEPVDDYNGWLIEIDRYAPASPTAVGLDPQVVEQADQYLRSVRSLAELMLSH